MTRYRPIYVDFYVFPSGVISETETVSEESEITRVSCVNVRGCVSECFHSPNLRFALTKTSVNPVLSHLPPTDGEIDIK